MSDELLKGLYKFCDEKSKNIKLKADPQVFVELCNALEELKELRNSIEIIEKASYNKAIDELVGLIEDTYGYDYASDINPLAEQLKDGGENG